MFLVLGIVLVVLAGVSLAASIVACTGTAQERSWGLSSVFLTFGLLLLVGGLALSSVGSATAMVVATTGVVPTARVVVEATDPETTTDEPETEEEEAETPQNELLEAVRTIGNELRSLRTELTERNPESTPEPASEPEATPEPEPEPAPEPEPTAEPVIPATTLGFTHVKVKSCTKSNEVYLLHLIHIECGTEFQTYSMREYKTGTRIPFRHAKNFHRLPPR